MTLVRCSSLTLAFALTTDPDPDLIPLSRWACRALCFPLVHAGSAEPPQAVLHVCCLHGGHRSVLLHGRNLSHVLRRLRNRRPRGRVPAWPGRWAEQSFSAYTVDHRQEGDLVPSRVALCGEDMASHADLRSGRATHGALTAMAGSLMATSSCSGALCMGRQCGSRATGAAALNQCDRQVQGQNGIFMWQVSHASIRRCRWLSSVFVHQSFNHVFSNITLLVAIGWQVEKKYGTWRVALLFWFAAIGGMTCM